MRGNGAPKGSAIPLSHPGARKCVLEPLGLQLPVFYPIVAVKVISVKRKSPADLNLCEDRILLRKDSG